MSSVLITFCNKLFLGLLLNFHLFHCHSDIVVNSSISSYHSTSLVFIIPLPISSRDFWTERHAEICRSLRRVYCLYSYQTNDQIENPAVSYRSPGKTVYCFPIFSLGKLVSDSCPLKDIYSSYLRFASNICNPFSFFVLFKKGKLLYLYSQGWI